MIIGIGIDFVEIVRFNGIENKREFIRQILTLDEISYLPQKLQQIQWLAIIFALKEAVMKAFGWGFTYGSFWQDIEVNDEGRINLLGKLKEQSERMKVLNIHSSYSHSKNYITAFVLLEG